MIGIKWKRFVLFEMCALAFGSLVPVGVYLRFGPYDALLAIKFFFFMFAVLHLAVAVEIFIRFFIKSKR